MTPTTPEITAWNNWLQSAVVASLIMNMTEDANMDLSQRQVIAAQVIAEADGILNQLLDSVIATKPVDYVMTRDDFRLFFDAAIKKIVELRGITV